MNRQKWLVLLAVLLILAGTASLLARTKASQRLGLPGLKVAGQPGTNAVRIELPAQVLDYKSKALEPVAEEVAALPKDTSFGRRVYESPDGNALLLSVVMMGTDRTSIHQPKFCLTGQGWVIEKTEQVTLPMSRPEPYDLPLTRLTASRKFMHQGQPVVQRGVYTYWFVADGAVTASAGERMRWMAADLLRYGVLQRWAYVSCFTVCAPGEEPRAIQATEQFLKAAVPEFQLATTLTRASGRPPECCEPH